MGSGQGVAGRWLVALAALALAGLLLVVLATRQGVGVTQDGIQYLRAARDLAAGRTMTILQSYNFDGPVPMTSRPPGLSLLLAAGTALGAPAVAVARWLNALLFAGSIFLVGLLTRRLTGSTRAALLAALIALLATDLVYFHALLLTEPLFLFLTLAALHALDRYLTAGGRAALLLSAAAAGLALVTRYQGIGLVAACGLAVLWWGRGGRRARLRDAATHGALAMLPLALWLVRNRLVADQRLYDRLAPGLPDLQLELVNNAAALTRLVWFFPMGGFRGPGTPVQQLLSAAVAATLIALAVGWALRRHRAGAQREAAEGRRLARLLLLFAASHWLAFYAALVVFFPSYFLEPRQMLPATLAVTLVAIAAATAWRPRRGAPWIRGAAALVAAAVVAGHLWSTGILLAEARRDGLGHNSLSWQRSATLAWLRDQEPRRPVFSNRANTIYFHTGIEARYLPCTAGHVWPSEDRTRFGPNPSFETQMDELERRIVDDGAVIVFFGARGGRRFPDPDKLAAALPIAAVASFPDAVVYARRP